MHFFMSSTKGINSCAVIGGNGFLGKAILDKLLLSGYTAYGVYHSSAENIPDGCIKISVEEFVEKPVTVNTIIFAAGSFSSSHEELVQLNCILIKKMIDQYPRARFVYVSSANVYGSHSEIISEKSAFNSPGLYGRAKLTGEFIVSMIPSFAIVRLVYLYGKGLDNGSFLTHVIRQAKLDKKIILYGKGQRKQDYLHVNDAAALCVKLADDEQNGIFIGATGRSFSNLEVAELIKETVPGCTIEFQGEEVGQSFFFDATETMEKCNWKPAISFSEGIKNMLT